MNFKRYHVSKNLWDGTYTKGFIGTTYIYKNTGTSANCAIIPCEPSTTYTVKKYDESNRFAIGTSNVLPYDEIQLTGVYYLDTATSYTFTTDSSAHYMVVYVSTGTEQVEPRLMVNTGSTALPYEPYSSEVWHDTPHYIHNTATDTLTTLPADIYANDTTATVGVKGNMSQSSTPTPSSPITPSECGDMTGNLFDGIIGTDNVILSENGFPMSNNAYALSEYIPVEPNTPYTYHFYHNIAENRSTYSICEYDSNKNVIAPLTLQWITENMDYDISFTTKANTAYIRINWKKAPDEDLMLISGSTPQPYEPYGQYKIPILSAGQTTPVYLGEVQSTRKIKKLVLTGDETAYAYEYSGNNGYSIRNVLDTSYSRAEGYCSHYVVSTATPSSGTTQVLWIGALNTHLYFVGIADIIGTTSANEFKQWLAQQYTAGTPVCVWYVLATPETAVVNEPIRKIGSYADEVSNVSIPVIAGANTLSVGTTLQPSEVTVNYKGWHPVADVHEKSRNLFDELYPDVTTTIVYKAINVGNGSFTLSTNAPLVNNGALLFMLAGDVTTGASTSNNGVSESVSRTVTAVNGYITIAYIIRGGKSPADYEVMLNTGSTVLPYEPYWT